MALEKYPGRNEIHPDALGRPLLSQAMSAEAYQARQDVAALDVPLGRVGVLKEPGYLSVFLASLAAAYITGQTWAVDGRVSIKHP